MRRWVFCAVLAAVVMPRTAGAQSLPLTEAEALARLSTESPRVRALRAAIDLARADVLLAGRWPNPRVTVNRESVAGTTEYLTMVGQPLPVTGIRALHVNTASALVDASAGRADDQVRRARADLRLAFAHLVAAQTRERELTAECDRLRELASMLARREAAGDAAGFDRLRAEREVLDIEADLTIASTDRARAQAAVAGFFAESIDSSRVVAAGSAPPAAPLPELDALVERAESTRGDLRALQKELEAAQWSMRAADRRRLPEPELVAGTKSSTALGGDVGTVLAVQMVLPLFDHGRTERASAQARARQAEARAEAMRGVLRADIAGLRAAAVARRDAAERYRTVAVDSADRIARIAQVSYEAGERGILELLDAYRLAAAARIRQATLDAGAREVEIELEFVSGWEIK